MARKKKDMMGPSYHRRKGSGHGFGPSKPKTKPLSGKAASKFRLDTQKAIARQKFREDSSPTRLKAIEESERRVRRNNRNK